MKAGRFRGEVVISGLYRSNEARPSKRLSDKSTGVYREVGVGNILKSGKVEQGRFHGLGNFSIQPR